MTDKKLMEVLEFYRHELTRRGVKPYKKDMDTPLQFQEEGAAHCLHMIEEMHRTEMIVKDREKAMRWLGFIQGALFMYGMYTIGQMRGHSRGAL